MSLIDKDSLVAEIERLKANARMSYSAYADGRLDVCKGLLSFIENLEVKEVDLDAMQRMEECPFRKVGCTMYEDKVLECNGACSWVVDYPKLKELKVQKGE